jgi:LuxR family maltose regulon positive regulatory protein
LPLLQLDRFTRAAKLGGVMGESLMSARVQEPTERDRLLETKLAIPRLRAEHLPRARLLARLDEGMACDLVLVCTPAGFGKTTLVADWARSGKWPVAWLSIDSDDNDPVRFWRYVIAALDRVSPGIGGDVLSLLAPPNVVSSRGVVTALIKDLEAMPLEIAVVLDDYHAIERCRSTIASPSSWAISPLRSI